MEHKMEKNLVSSIEQKKNTDKRRRKRTYANLKFNQVTENIADYKKNSELNMTKTCLKISSCTSSYENNEVTLRSNSTPTLLIENIYHNRDHVAKHSNYLPKDISPKLLSTYSDSSSSKPLEDNRYFKVNVIQSNVNMDSKDNLKKRKKRRPKNNFQVNILGYKYINQFEKYENSDKVRCNFCYCLFDEDESKLTNHAKECKTEKRSNFDVKFNCLVCNKEFKTFKKWKSHAIMPSHLSKCTIENDYVSYNCGSCKTLYFGRIEEISNHSKLLHHDSSHLPCIFKCMKKIFHEFVIVDPGSTASWTFCGPCRKYSCEEFNCILYNHNNKKINEFNCKSCSLSLICNKLVYDNHLLSCEHIMLERLRATNEISQPVDELKLLPIFLNRFIIDGEKATCNDCKLQMVANEKTIIVHLTECNCKTDFGGKNLTKFKTFFCAVCSLSLTDFSKWKYHMVSPSHLIKCFNINDLVSYTCEICELHCYGSEHNVSDHQKIHPNNSEKKLSEYIAFNFRRINKDLSCNDFYYCEDCETYAETVINSEHWNKSHKTKLKRMICRACRTEFFCIEGNELFRRHLLSSEHITLKYLANRSSFQDLVTSPVNKSQILSTQNSEDHEPSCSKDTSKMTKSNDLLVFKSYSNWFRNSEDQNKAICTSCEDLIDINENAFLDHMLVCELLSTGNVPKLKINNFKCFKCNFHSKMYDAWKNHAILHKTLNPHGLYSHFCKICNSIFYGKIDDIELHLNNEHKKKNSNIRLEAVLLAEQLVNRKNNFCKFSDAMCFCELCKKMFRVADNPNHFNTNTHIFLASDLTELFYCQYCDIEFNSSYEIFEYHKLTVEHIILSSIYNNVNDENLPLSSKLDNLLFKYIKNQKLYNETQNIGFFCFDCNFVCISLTIWKNHINCKKHDNSSKGLYLDHRCKICKTLMFGKRQHIFEHYSNCFHLMLKQFKLMPFIEKNDSLLQLNSEMKSLNDVKPNPDKNQTGVVDDNTTPIDIKEAYSLTNMMDELSLQSNSKCGNDTIEGSSTNIQVPNEVHLVSKVMNKLPFQQNIQYEENASGESTCNTDETNSMVKIIKKLLFQSNTQYNDGNKLEEPTFKNNEINSNITDKLPVKTNSQNYINYYAVKVNMLKEILNQKKEIKPQMSYYCAPCDFITAVDRNWDEHNSTIHLNKDELRHHIVCNICSLCQVGPSDNLKEHINTDEHKSMVEFQKLCDSINMKKTNNETIEKIENKNGPVPDTNLNNNKHEKKHKKDEEKEEINRRLFIEVKGVKSEYKNKNWTKLKEIFSSYGYFGVYPKHSYCLILFRKLTSIHKVLKDQEQLEKTHEFTLSVFDVDERLPDLNKNTEFEFANKDVLLKTINAQIMAIKQEITNPDILERISLLTRSIKYCVWPHFKSGKAYPFGSRMSGLALKESDVDVYFDIGYTFNGILSDDPSTQEDLVKYFGKVFRSYNKEFKQIQLICSARVPIVKFLHVSSGLYCDLSFKSGLSTHNTKLVRLYLTLDEQIHWIVCAVVKRWALQNDLKNQSMFTSYALVWLVLFYLMTIDVVPSLKLLRQHASRSDIMFIEDWDCTFCPIEIAKQIWKVPQIPCWDLLYGFFKYYSEHSKLKHLVLCPVIGEAIPKAKFVDIPMNNKDILGFYKKKNCDAQRSTKIMGNFFGEGLAVQDPFDLFHNITKVIIPRKLQIFSHLCKKTYEVMHNGIQPYYA